ncbi:MAG: transporter substrate-binding domain-containing protein [Desulfovibrio sp.]|jgi:signal transduction histidine kinase/CheY-like chemotaxis protein|nr:transporter substrate-binding domain-containing protein [Desulfovibrio sp.]
MRCSVFRCALFASAALCVALLGAAAPAASQADTHDGPLFTDFRTVPGVTAEEIRDIEELQARKVPFVYAMTLGNETYLEDGGIAGFTSLFCRWLSRLFSMSFRPSVTSWAQIVDGLDAGNVDFTGDMTRTPGRLRTYLMTEPIVSRRVTMLSLDDTPAMEVIARTREVRFCLLADSVEYELVQQRIPENSRIIYKKTFQEIYDAMRSGEVDFFISDDGTEINFDIDRRIIMTEFSPPIYSNVSLTAKNEKYKSIISIVSKALMSGERKYISRIFNEGMKNFSKQRVHRLLTEVEREYIDRHRTERIPIKYFADAANYPVSFYNEENHNWEGIGLDILNEIAHITGLNFIPANNKNENWSNILKMLRKGDASLIVALARSREREPFYIWSKKDYYQSHCALLSKLSHPSIYANEIIYSKVGIIKDNMTGDLFLEWFPNTTNVMLYDSYTSLAKALRDNEIDMMMGLQEMVLNEHNYNENADIKTCYLFNYGIPARFGFNSDEKILRSIFDKTLKFIDTEAISQKWTFKAHDHRAEMAEVRMRWLSLVIFLMVCLVAMLGIALYWHRTEKTRLQDLVKQKTLDLQLQMEEAKHANKAKSIFLATISHEIRTPLNAIIGITEIQRGKCNDEDTRNYIDKVYKAGEMLIRIINDVLDISKIEAGNIELNPFEYDVAMLIADATRLNALRIGSKDIDFVIDINGDFPSRLVGDEMRVRQILNNLLSNAIKYTQQGTVVLRMRWVPGAADDLDQSDAVTVTIEVEDTGRGIRESDMGDLFTAFKQFDVQQNRRIEGTGLGLSITKEVVELMHGSIDVRSVYGKGSVFTVRIVQRTVGAPPLGEELAAELRRFWLPSSFRRGGNIVRHPVPHGNVLLVDDVPTNLEVLEGLLTPYGLQIDSVGSGEEAVDRVRNGGTRYDLILMDHMMPGMDGVEATRLIRETIDTDYARNVPIVAVTANVLVAGRDMFLAKGFNGYISKPINVVQLDSVLTQWNRGSSETEEDAGGGFRDDAPEGATGGGAEGEAEAERRPGHDERSGADAMHVADLADERVEGLDIREGIATYGDPGLYLHLLHTFLQHTLGLLETLRNVDAASLKAYQVAVHGLKGSAYGVCAREVGRCAEGQETAARDGDAQKVLAGNDGLIRMVEEMLKALGEVLRRHPDAG